jgi:CubicO group peptidase (beta-lactamase class C family)
VTEAASGVLNVETGVAVTPDSLFQIGSVSKLFTATLVMQLVDEGLVALDDPVRTHVPEFSLADASAADAVTIRQLLSHTGGFDGDVFDDFGRGDEAIERYVTAMKDKRQIHPPGALFSYCNSGYAVLGRLIEHARALPSWDAALRTHLIEPLGLTHTVSLPEEVLRFRAAVGHVPGEGEDVRVTSESAMTPRALGPAGATVCSTVGDLLRFARAHMRGGLADDGSRILSAESTAAMQEPQVALPVTDELPPDAWCLGWSRLSLVGGRTVHGHHGDTAGQQALLRMFPDRGIGFAVLTNGGSPMSVYQALRTSVYPLAGVEAPPLPSPPPNPIEIDVNRFIGRYENSAMRFDITLASDGRLACEVNSPDAPPEATVEDSPFAVSMVGLTPSVLITAESHNGYHETIGFPEPYAGGRARYLFCSNRIAKRVETV